jgi:hypothetical protein
MLPGRSIPGLESRFAADFISVAESRSHFSAWLFTLFPLQGSARAHNERPWSAVASESIKEWEWALREAKASACATFEYGNPFCFSRTSS